MSVNTSMAIGMISMNVYMKNFKAFIESFNVFKVSNELIAVIVLLFTDIA